jgi:predicted nucleotidyltransferase
MYKKTTLKEYNKEYTAIAGMPQGPLSVKIQLLPSLILSSIGKKIVQKIYLFGSYAYGTPNKDSDLDICVVINNIDKGGSGVYGKISEALRRNNIDSYDLLIYYAEDIYGSKNINSIQNVIIRKGRLLYRNPHADEPSLEVFFDAEKDNIVDEKKYVTQTPFELFHDAEVEIYSINVKMRPELRVYRWSNSYVCSYARKAVTKFLKGYVINNVRLLKKKMQHPVKLLQTASRIDASFKSLRRECKALGKYDEDYTGDKIYNITRQEFINVTDALKKIINFPPILQLRNEYSTKEDYKLFILDNLYYTIWKGNKWTIWQIS